MGVFIKDKESVESVVDRLKKDTEDLLKRCNDVEARSLEQDALISQQGAIVKEIQANIKTYEHAVNRAVATLVDVERKLSTVENGWSDAEYVDFCLTIAAEVRDILENELAVT